MQTRAACLQAQKRRHPLLSFGAMLLPAASAEACPPPQYRHCAPLIPVLLSDTRLSYHGEKGLSTNRDRKYRENTDAGGAYTRRLRLSKTYGWHRRARKPFDFRSKIGDMRGDFRAILLAKSLPYTSKRPGEPFMARPVRECNSSKKCLKHFFDTLRRRLCPPPACQQPHHAAHESGQTDAHHPYAHIFTSRMC